MAHRPAATNLTQTALRVVSALSVLGLMLPYLAIPRPAHAATPVITTVANMTVSEGSTATQVVTATDSSGHAVTFQNLGVHPIFMNVFTTTPGTGTGTGAVFVNPGFGDAGVYPGNTFTVSDGTNTATSNPFTITVLNVNRAPTLNQPPNLTVTVGNTLQYTGLAASDPDNDTMTLAGGVANYAFTHGAQIINVVSNPGLVTGTLSWTPTAADVGAYSTTICVTDNGAPPLPNCKTFTITVVAGTNHPPIATATGPGGITVNCGESVSFDVSATDPDGDLVDLTNAPGIPYTSTPPATFTVTNQHSLNPVGHFQWTPGITGNFVLFFRATDGSLFGNASRVITALGCSPVIDSITGTGDTVVTKIDATHYQSTIYRDQLLSFDVHAVDPDTGDSISYISYNNTARGMPNPSPSFPTINPIPSNPLPGIPVFNSMVGTFAWQPCLGTANGIQGGAFPNADSYQDCLSDPTPTTWNGFSPPGAVPYVFDFISADSSSNQSTPVRLEVHVINRPPTPHIGLLTTGVLCPQRPITFTSHLTGRAALDIDEAPQPGLNPFGYPNGFPVSDWTWNYGDGVIESTAGGFPNMAAPTHTYATAGTKNVTVSVNDWNNVLNLAPGIMSITIPPNNPPVISSVVSPGHLVTSTSPGIYDVSIFRDEPLQLIATGTDPQGGAVTLSSSNTLPIGDLGIAASFIPATGILNWKPCLAMQSGTWPNLNPSSFENCLTLQTKTDWNPNPSPNNPFTVDFWATDSDSCQLVGSHAVVRVTVMNRPPVALPNLASTGIFCSEIPIQFTSTKGGKQLSDLDTGPRIGTPATPNSHYIYWWKWFYGDGVIKKGNGLGGGAPLMAVPFHTYSNPGTYRVKLNVEDWNGTPTNWDGGPNNAAFVDVPVQKTSWDPSGKIDGQNPLRYMINGNNDLVAGFKIPNIAGLDLAAPVRLLAMPLNVDPPNSGSIPVITTTTVVTSGTTGTARFANKDMDNMFVNVRPNQSVTYQVRLAIKMKGNNPCKFAFIDYQIVVTK